MKYNFGIVKELKDEETRVALTPDAVAMLVADGFSVALEAGAGEKSGFSDGEYIENGAQIKQTASEVWQNSKIIVKIKEPQTEEYQYFRPDLIIFSYLHLTKNLPLAREILNKKVTAISSEAVKTHDMQLPLLTPMSEVAGRLAIQMGAHLLQSQDGSGVLLSGVPGVQPGKVIIIGAGVAGFNAMQVAIGMGADVSIFDTNPKKLAKIDSIYGSSIKTHYSNRAKILSEVPKADLLVTCALNKDEDKENPNILKSSKIVPEEVVKKMKKGSVIVDLSIDRNANVETIDRPTTFSDPYYIKHGVLHCAILNLPSAVSRTASMAHSYAIYPYLKSLAEFGLIETIKSNPELSNGVSAFNGEVTDEKTAKLLNHKYTQIELLVGFKLK